VLTPKLPRIDFSMRDSHQRDFVANFPNRFLIPNL